MDRLGQLLQDLLGTSLSAGTVARWIQAAGARVRPLVETIRGALQQSEVVHCDETGLYVAGQRYWLHVTATPELTLYVPHARRGKAGTDAVGILPGFGGTAVHDNWSAYGAYGCRHGLCNAHHLRELTYLHETDECAWALDLKNFLVDTYRLVETARQQGYSALPSNQLAAVESGYQQLVDQALGATEPPPKGWPQGKRGRPKKPKARNLAERFDQHRGAILAFVYDFAVPFDNNLVERDIRMVKVQQKISGCFRSWPGAEAACNLRSYLSTMRKQDHSAFQVLCQLFAGQPLLPCPGP
jgi:transposase